MYIKYFLISGRASEKLVNGWLLERESDGRKVGGSKKEAYIFLYALSC